MRSRASKHNGADCFGFEIQVGIVESKVGSPRGIRQGLANITMSVRLASVVFRVRSMQNLLKMLLFAFGGFNAPRKLSHLDTVVSARICISVS